MCFHKRVLMFTSMHKFSVTWRACWTSGRLCASLLSCWRIFTQAHLRHLKRPSCSLLFWNRSQRRPRITVMMCVREKSKGGNPCLQAAATASFGVSLLPCERCSFKHKSHSQALMNFEEFPWSRLLSSSVCAASECIALYTKPSLAVGLH